MEKKHGYSYTYSSANKASSVSNNTLLSSNVEVMDVLEAYI